MKKIISFLLLLSIFNFYACEKCEIIELPVEDPDPIFDCPDLELNIGDACDDGNPDTNNDVINENCECVGEPIINCSGRLLVGRIETQNDILGPIFLDSAEKRPVNQVDFNLLESINGSAIQEGEVFPFQFSTINPSQNQYFFDFQYENSSFLDPLLISSTDGTSAPSYILSELPYAAPIFHQGTMYAIDVEYDDPIAQYSILSIDLISGQINTLFTGSVTVNSQVANPAFFSASNGNNKVFFLAGTSLFEYDVSANTVTHVILEPNPNPDFPVAYTGLEYQADSDRLLALKSFSNAGTIESELIAISQDGTFAQSVLIDIDGYTLFSDSGILHATAFSQCDNIYYITSIKELEVTPFESVLIEIDINNNSISDKTFSDFLFGIEVDEE